MNNRASILLSSTSRVESPFVRVTIGDFTFGTYENNRYPNFIQSLRINKLNGTVNQYYLTISYAITEGDDPNFFEKLFGTISDTRKLKISYGDSLLPEYVYKDESAIITNIRSNYDFQRSVISYDIEAVSASKLTLGGTYTFPARRAKPSDVIYELLSKNATYHLLDVFTGMRDLDFVKSNNLIAGDDSIVDIPTKTNTSILDYISFLVQNMKPNSDSSANAILSGFYMISTFDENIREYGGQFLPEISGGPYFKVQKIAKSKSYINNLCTYEVDIGYPSANVITNFRVKNNENWSIYYNYNKTLNDSEYLQRINSEGELVEIYSPNLTNTKFDVKTRDQSWWTKVTQYPVEVELTIKGLLRPAILMQYLKLNVFFHGHKHLISGYYIITGQVDNIGYNGYTTTLSLLRVAQDEEIA